MATLRVERICGHATELLELHSSSKPRLHIVFTPGNPGIVSYYKDYLTALYRHFHGAASITAVGHIAHTAQDYEKGKTYSLQQQIDHKAGFLRDRIGVDHPTILVGHSIGAYIVLELLKKFPDKLQCVVGLQPFMKTNPDSLKQALLKFGCESSLLRATLSSFAGLVGQSPAWFSKRLVQAVFGRAWGPCAVDTTCDYLLRSSMVANFAYMGMTEFAKLKEEVDWEFLKGNRAKVCLLFGLDDHWGPLSLMKQVKERVPGLKTAVVDSNTTITHDFCCTESGSEWVARFTADAIKETLGANWEQAFEKMYT